LEGIRFAREEAKGRVPIVGNGDIFKYEDSEHMRKVTGVNSVMAARGLLENPVCVQLLLCQEFY
jgi:tRNA-dihydrouridine synthase 4